MIIYKYEINIDINKNIVIKLKNNIKNINQDIIEIIKNNNVLFKNNYLGKYLI